MTKVYGTFITLRLACARVSLWGNKGQNMQVEAIGPDGVFRIIPRRIEDARGYFTESWNDRGAQAAGLPGGFVQDNQSYSAATGTLRGLHYQAPPHAQDKLVRVVQGAIYDVAVDVRAGSPSFGRWIRVELSAENGHQLFVPKGFLHGFVTLRPDTVVLYKTTAHYDAACDGAVAFDCPDLAIDWGMDAANMVTSAKDAAAPALCDWRSPFGQIDEVAA